MQYCITAHACTLVGLQGLSDCASSTAGPPPSVERCVAAAGNDCAAARACLYDATHSSLCTFGEAPRCDGEVALTCDGQTTTTSQTDCARVGRSCVAGPSQALCAFGKCDRPPEDSWCEGQVAARCARPFVIGTDCAAVHAICTPPADGSDGGVASCTGTGTSCLGGAQCDDRHTLDLCLDFHRATLACATDELCWPANQVIDHATCGLGNQCDPPTYFDNCVGGKVTYCRRGRIEKIDCVALGFAGCSSAPSSGCVTSLGDAGLGPPLTDMPLP